MSEEQENNITKLVDRFSKDNDVESISDLYVSYLKSPENYIYEPHEEKAFFKIHTTFMNVDKTDTYKEVVKAYRHKINKKELDLKKEIISCVKKIKTDTAEHFEIDLINGLGAELISQSYFDSKDELRYISGMIDGIENVINKHIGKYTTKFIKTDVSGQSSFFAPKELLEKSIKGVCSRNTKITNELLWDGSAGEMKNVAFLFSEPRGPQEDNVIRDLANDGLYSIFIETLLTEEQKNQFTQLKNKIKEVFNKKIEDTIIPIGLSSVFFPCNNKKNSDYVLITPVISGDVQLKINEENFGNKNSFSTRTIKRGGANPQNAGWLSKTTNGNHIHLFSKIKFNTIAYKEKSYNYENNNYSIMEPFNMERPILKKNEKLEKKYNLQECIYSFNDILNERVKNKQNMKEWHFSRLEKFSSSIARLGLENFSNFIDEYELFETIKSDGGDDIVQQKEKPKNMRKDVYDAIVLYHKNYDDFIIYMVDYLTKRMTVNLNDAGVQNIFKTAVRKIIKEMF